MTANNYRGRLYSEAMQQTLSGQLAIWQDIEGESRIDDAEPACWNIAGAILPSCWIWIWRPPMMCNRRSKS